MDGDIKLLEYQQLNGQEITPPNRKYVKNLSELKSFGTIFCFEGNILNREEMSKYNASFIRIHISQDSYPADGICKNFSIIENGTWIHICNNTKIKAKSKCNHYQKFKSNHIRVSIVIKNSWMFYCAIETKDDIIELNDYVVIPFELTQYIEVKGLNKTKDYDLINLK
uniref:Galectin n=1 Tax=Meloidogyne hapla TaxID=6305 RepID=A0A1I8BH16_MELHA